MQVGLPRNLLRIFYYSHYLLSIFALLTITAKIMKNQPLSSSQEPTQNLEIPVGVLTHEERTAITIRADARRRNLQFRIEAQKIKSANASTVPAVQKSLEGGLDVLFRTVAGDALAIPPGVSNDALIKKLDEFLSYAKLDENVAPNLAALEYAQAAKLQLQLGRNVEQALNMAKALLDKSKGIVKETPAALMTDAIILSIEKSIAKKLILPTPERVAGAILEDRILLGDYALVLNEAGREQLLAAVPENKKMEIGALLDRALSNVLQSTVILGDEELAQYGRVRSRAIGVMEQILNDASSDERALIKVLTETLIMLNTEENKRALLELGTKAVFARGPGEATLPYIARIIKNLADVDTAKAGNLAMKFLAKKELNQKYFIFFVKLLIKKEYLTSATTNYLKEPRNIPILKRLIAEYPNQYNTVIDTISKIQNYIPGDHEEEIFSAIRDLDSLTPIIFNRYRMADAKGKRELARQIKELKPKFFSNTPIKMILPKKDQEILTEMVHLAYKPINMSFTQVEALMQKLHDQTEDLADIQFPEEGYPFMLGGARSYVLRKGETLDAGIPERQVRLVSYAYPQDDEAKKTFSALLIQLTKCNSNLSDEDMSRLLSVMGADEFTQKFALRYHDKINARDTHNCLSEMKEIFGVYFNDNYHERLASFLGANPSIWADVAKSLTNPKKILALRSQLGLMTQDIRWEALDDRREVARLLALFFGAKILRSTREKINASLKKFVIGGDEKQSAAVDGKLYISKNIGSFFAKASAGICTAEDIELFKREDHFHMNVVEGDAYVRANIQGYFIKEGDGKSLVLRGFNPNNDFLNKIDVPEFCEKVLAIAGEFCAANNLKKLYIAEQDGGWHALSNRASVAAYLMKKYCKAEKAKTYQLQVTSGHSISTIYEI